MRRIAASVALLLAALAAPSAGAAFTPAEKAAMQQAVEAQMRSAGYPGIVAGLWVPGRGSFVSATGIAERPTDRRVRTRDVFRIGSVTKTFTATVILQLVQEGRLRLTDRLSRYVEGIPAGHRVTIRQLLNHTSGIPDTSNALARAVFRDPDRRWRPSRVIRNAVRQKRYCRPGACWHYSNTNYQLLGVIARRITGRSMAGLYERRVLRRAGLRRTSFHPQAGVPAPAAHGYLRETLNGPLVDTTGWNLSWSWTAGSMTSTLSDMRRWAAILATGRGVLGRRVQRARLRFVQTTTPGLDYGLGIMRISGFVGHDGAVPGYDSLVLYAPTSGATLVLLGNTAVELNATKGGSPPTLLTLATCFVEIADGQAC